MALSKKQRIFIDEYLKCWNATEAARRAGYSVRTASVIGYENIRKPYIAEEIKRRLEESAMSADEVLNRLADIARGDVADFMTVTSSGFIVDLTEKDENGNPIVNPKTKLIKKVKQKVITSLSKKQDGEDKEIIETELELYSAQEALNTLGKHHKIFTENIDLTSGGKPLKGYTEVSPDDWDK